MKSDIGLNKVRSQQTDSNSFDIELRERLLDQGTFREMNYRESVR